MSRAEETVQQLQRELEEKQQYTRQRSDTQDVERLRQSIEIMRVMVGDRERGGYG